MDDMICVPIDKTRKIGFDRGADEQDSVSLALLNKFGEQIFRELGLGDMWKLQKAKMNPDGPSVMMKSMLPSDYPGFYEFWLVKNRLTVGSSYDRVVKQLDFLGEVEFTENEARLKIDPQAVKELREAINPTL